VPTVPSRADDVTREAVAELTENDAGEIKVDAERGLAIPDVAAAPHGGDARAVFRGAKTAPLRDLSTSSRAPHHTPEAPLNVPP
jgi:hypothetical protein